MSQDKIQTWSLLCAQSVKSSGALRAYGSSDDAIADARATIAYLIENIEHSRVTQETFRHLLQIGDRDLIDAAFTYHGADKFRALEAAHAGLSYKGAISRGDFDLLVMLDDLGFKVAQVAAQIMRAGLERDCIAMTKFAKDRLSFDDHNIRSQMPFFIRICGPACAPILDDIITSHLDDWRQPLGGFLITACNKVDVKVAVILTLFGITTKQEEIPYGIFSKQASKFLFEFLSGLSGSNHAQLRLLALQRERISILGRPHLADFAGISRSKVLMGQIST